MGFGILIPMNSPMGMILGIISIIIILIFVLLIIGSIFSSLISGIVNFIGIINDEKDLWYHKKDKNYGIAFLCSLLLPFSGSLYLKENITSLIVTILSIIMIFVTMFGLLTIPDFYYHNGYVITLLVILWIISLLSLLLNIRQYNKYKSYYPENKESELSFINDKILIAIPIIIFILFLSVNVMVMNDTSDKLYENDHYSLVYPNNYVIGIRDNTEGSSGVIFTDFDCLDSNGQITVATNKAFSSSWEESKNKSLNYYKELGAPVKYNGTKTIDGVKGYILEYEGHWITYKFITGGTEYTITFTNSYDCMDNILNSFKFK